MDYSFNMQGIGVIFVEGEGELALQKCRLIALQFRQNFKPRVDFVNYSPSQRTFYAITTDYIRHLPPTQRTFYAITTSTIRHHWHISTLIHRNPTDHYDIHIRAYLSQSLPSILRIYNAISTDNTP